MSTKEAMLDLSGSRRRGSAPKAGSVWESRMKLDEVKGGFKVFNPTHENSQENTQSTNSTSNNPEAQIDIKVNDVVRPKQSPIGMSGKRKTWKSGNSEGSPVQIARQRSELIKNLDQDFKESSVSGDGIKKSPVWIKKKRSLSSSDGNEKNAVQLRKVKSDSTEVINDSKIELKSENSEGSPVQIARQRSELIKNLDQDFKELSVSADGIKKSPVWIKKKRSLLSSDGNDKNTVQLRKVKSDSTEVINHDSEIEVKSEPSKKLDEKIKNSDDKKVVVEPNRDLEGYNGKADKSPGGVKISRSDENCKDGEEKTDLGDDDEKEDMEIEVEKKSIEIKEISVIEDKKLLHSNEISVLISPIVKKQIPSAVNHARFHPSPTKTKPISDHFHGIPRSRTNSRLQSFVDLVMWKDVSKSAFIFGIGTFGIISSSYTKDLNISFISVMSYLGLVYLAAIFLFRSLITSGSMDMDSANQDCVVGEEEAIWVVKLVLPYLNEFLLKLRAFFSGDPATTMKLAVLLFILARCGSSITIWKMAKLGFIGVFTVPKICSTYSSQITAYGTFWIQRFGDAWESCSHKKAVAFAIFTLAWNLSSVVARIWTVFMLFVAFKYYQQSLIREGWTNEEKSKSIGGRRSPLSESENRRKCVQTRVVDINS